MRVTVRGATLAGMAAAARLARLGHDVTLVTEGVALGQRWAAVAGPGGHTVDAMAPVILLPAAWRDLFKKSGAHLVTDLNGTGLTLIPAPAPEHRLADGSLLRLPTDRGAQFKEIEALHGAAAATGWRDLLDELDSLWHAYRAHALEATAPVTSRAARRRLWSDVTIGDLAARLPAPLQDLLLAQADGPHSPALTALPLVVERTFGRWALVDEAGLPQRAGLLVELLAARLRARGVSFADDAPDTDIDARPHRPRAPFPHRAPRPARAPLISHEFVVDASPIGLQELVDHTGERPVTTWRRPVTGGTLVTVHDHRRPTPDLDHGLAALNFNDWLRRPPIIDADTIRASACSPAGAQPWAELGSSALAVYALHERLTGEDCRPANKDFRLPRAAP